MWHIFVLLLSFGVYLFAGAVVSFCIWYLLFLFLKPLKIDKLFDIELPLPIIMSLMGICICYGYNVRGILNDADGVNEDGKNKQVHITKKKDEKKKIFVYICTGETSTKYHSDPDCRGLGRCTGEIEEVSEEDAEDMGRTPCRICY